MLSSWTEVVSGLGSVKDFSPQTIEYRVRASSMEVMGFACIIRYYPLGNFPTSKSIILHLFAHVIRICNVLQIPSSDARAF